MTRVIVLCDGLTFGGRSWKAGTIIEDVEHTPGFPKEARGMSTLDPEFRDKHGRRWFRLLPEQKPVEEAVSDSDQGPEAGAVVPDTGNESDEGTETKEPSGSDSPEDESKEEDSGEAGSQEDESQEEDSGEAEEPEKKGSEESQDTEEEENLECRYYQKPYKSEQWLENHEAQCVQNPGKENDE